MYKDFMERHIKLLKTIAEDLEPVSNARISAMILYKGKAVAFGFNQYKSHPFAAKYSKHPEAIYLHAETDAINKASKKLTPAEMKKTTLIIVRVKSDLKNRTMYGLAKPCPGCAKCIEDIGIKKVVYTDDCDVNKLKFFTEIC